MGESVNGIVFMSTPIRAAHPCPACYKDVSHNLFTLFSVWKFRIHLAQVEAEYKNLTHYIHWLKTHITTFQEIWVIPS